MKKELIWGGGLTPFFTPEDFLPSYPTLTADLRTDVLVIGGGLSGLLCAAALLRAGREVTLVTANTVADGACRFSCGVVPGDGGPDLVQLRLSVGQENAVSWTRSCASAVDRLEKIVAEIGSRCDFRRRDLFYYTANGRDVSALREEYLVRHHIGIPCSWLDENECSERFSFPCAGGFLTRNGGAELNAVRFCRDLAAYLTVHGVTVLEGTHIDSIEAKAKSEFVCRAGERSVTAARVVDARGGSVLTRRPQLGRRLTVFSVATEPVPNFRGWQDQCLIKGYDSFSFLRTTPDGRIVYSAYASGLVTPDGKLGPLDAEAFCRFRFRQMAGELKEKFVGIPRIRCDQTFRQGIVMTKRGLPLLGRDPQWKDLFYLYAFGECGIAGAVLGADWIARMAADPAVNCPEYLNA